MPLQAIEETEDPLLRRSARLIKKEPLRLERKKHQALVKDSDDKDDARSVDSLLNNLLYVLKDAPSDLDSKNEGVPIANNEDVSENEGGVQILDT